MLYKNAMVCLECQQMYHLLQPRSFSTSTLKLLRSPDCLKTSATPFPFSVKGDWTLSRTITQRGRKGPYYTNSRMTFLEQNPSPATREEDSISSTSTVGVEELRLSPPRRETLVSSLNMNVFKHRQITFPFQNQNKP